MYVWGATWEEAKRHGECLHYLFEIAINMNRLGLDFLSAPSQVTNSGKCIGKRIRSEIEVVSGASTSVDTNGEATKFKGTNW